MEQPVLRDRVYFVGLRYAHHAKASGYEAFGRYVGTSVEPPVDFRWTLGDIGWKLSKAFARVTRHPWYSIGAHLTEWHALGHMISRRNSLFHVLYGDSDLWLLRHANRLTGNRLVASFHQPTEELRPLGAIPRVARSLDAAVLVCEAQRPFFEEFLPKQRITVIPHGVNTSFFRPPPTRSEAPVCITVGSHLRDFETLRDAIHRVWKEEPRMRFIAVGTRTDKKSMFPAVEDPRIQFLDRISDEQLLAAYQSAQLAVFSFKNGTANNAMLEAMATGLPVVATDVGGIGEYVGPNCGRLCAANDPAALAERILSILSAPAMRTSMSAEARRHAERLDFSVIGSRMADFYESLLNSGG